MDDREALSMMQRVRDDIMRLRAERDALAPAAEAYGVIRDIMRLVPQPSRGYGEDVVWTLEKRIRELETAAKKDVES